VIAAYEALRPPGPEAAPPARPGLVLLQRCGLALWAQTCSGVGSSPRVAPGTAAEGDGAVGRAAARLPVPDTVRDQLTVVLASMVAHHRPGGDYEHAKQCPAAAVDAGSPR
jgi:hypothetical protein